MMVNGEPHPTNEGWTADVCTKCGTFLGWWTPNSYIGLFHDPCWKKEGMYSLTTYNPNDNIIDATATKD